MKKSSKIIIIALLVIIAMLVATSVYAVNPNSIVVNTAGNGVNTIKSVGGTVLGYVRIVGSVLAVVVLTIIGVKYMMGSAEEKAEYKKSMMPYLIGAVLIFASSQLAGLIYNFSTSI
jgi:hypothetical protein